MRVFSAASLFALAGTAMAGTFQMNPSWDGPNPSNVGFGLYLPTTVKPNAPLVVMIHWCQGSAQATYNNGNNGFVTLADRYGFPVIFPDSPNTAATKCWDVGSAATLKHNGGGDSYGIANFAKYVVKKYNLDPKRVFVTGGSSGAMMTQVLAGAYPDVFAAAAPSSGVPFGCWANGGVAQWNSDCAHGRITHTGAEWAQIVKNAYPGYTGSRPKIALFHGTADATVDYKNQLEAIKEWTAVLGVSETPTSTVQNSPSSGWTKTVYGSGQVEAYANQGGGHGISYQTGTMATFFGLADPPTNGPAPTTSSPTPEPTTKTPVPTTKTPVPTTATVAPTTTVKPAPGGAKKWGQCGGSGWTGPTTCEEGSCVKVNDWYSQCQ